MKKAFLICIISMVAFTSCNQTVEVNNASEAAEKKAILSVMEKQEKAWSNHNLEGFMEGYWKSDSLKFYGRNGITFGWQKTLDNYKKGYPTKEHSGTLSFKVNDISKITNGAYSVMGEYHLKRSVGDANGVFMIIFKKINNKWKIIADTSC